MAEDGDALPAPRSSSATCRVVWLLPEPVRTAQIATTGFDEREHRVAQGEEDVVGAGGEGARPDVHHVLVRHVRVREDDLVDLVLADDALEVGLREDRDPSGTRRRRAARG